MPGLGGYIFKSKNEYDKTDSKTFIESMYWKKNYNIQQIHIPKKNISLIATSSPAITISSIKNNHISSVFFGELYCEDNPSSKTNPINSHNLLIENYFKYGEDYFNHVDGSFLIAIWNSSENELVIANDTFGIFPLNYYQDSNRFVFCSQIKPIMKITKINYLDELAYAEYLALGLTLNAKTFVKDIIKLWPGSILKYRDGNLKIIKYFKPFYTYFNGTKKSKDKLLPIVDAFNSSVQKRIYKNEKIIAALSGGFDTRAIWSIISAKKFKIDAATLGEKESADLKIAKKICSKENINHKIYIISEDFWNKFFDYMIGVVNMTEGFTDISSAILIPYYKWLGTEYNVMIDGPGGALYRRQAFSRYNNQKKNINKLTKYIYNYLLKLNNSDDILDKEFTTNFDNSIYEGISTYFYKYESYGSNQDLLDLFYLHQFIGLKYSAESLLQSNYINFRQPFFDNNTFNLIRSCTPLERRKLNFHKQIVESSNPSLSKIELVSTDVIVPYKGFRWRRNIPLGIKYLQSKTNIKIPILNYLQGPTVNFESAFRYKINKLVKEVLFDQKTIQRNYFNLGKLEQKINAHENNSENHTNTIIKLMTAELTIRNLFEN